MHSRVLKANFKNTIKRAVSYYLTQIIKIVFALIVDQVERAVILINRSDCIATLAEELFIGTKEFMTVKSNLLRNYTH